MKITNQLLYDTFPDSLPIIKRNLRFYKNIQLNLNSIYSDVYSRAYIRGDAWFFSIMIEAFRSKEYEKHIVRLEVLKGFYEYNIEKEKQKKDPEYKPKYIKKPLDVERAKQFPIDEMHHFDKFKRNGNKIFVCCPFHGEKTGSLCIYTTTNTFYCFGCHASGDSIKFYALLHGYDTKSDFREVVCQLGG